MAVSAEFKTLLIPRTLIATAILILLLSSWGFLVELRMAGAAVTTQATVIDKELLAQHPVYYEITYAFSVPVQGDGELRDYSVTAGVSRDFYNQLRLGDQIVITYPSGHPLRAVLGPEFLNPTPWAFPLFGLSISIILLLLGRHQLLRRRSRLALAGRHRREG